MKQIDGFSEHSDHEKTLIQTDTTTINQSMMTRTPLLHDDGLN